MITARIADDFPRDGHHVLLKERIDGKTYYLVPGQPEPAGFYTYPGWARVPVTEAPMAEDHQPLWLPTEALQAIVEAGAAKIGPDLAGAVDRHLNDAIATRDMLLEVVRASAFDRIRSGAALERSTV